LMLISWVFAGGLGPPDALKSKTLDLAVRMLLEPPGNRFIVPLVLAALLVLGRLKREQRLLSPAAPAPTEGDVRVVG